MGHRSPEGFGIRLALAAGKGDGVGAAVVLDDPRVIDRDVIGALLEFSDGIAPIGHHLRHKRIGLTNALGGGIDERSLDALPLREVLLASLLRQLDDIELLAPLHAAGQLALGLAAIAGLLDRSLVFGAERILQAAGLPLVRDDAMAIRAITTTTAMTMYAVVDIRISF